MAFEIPTNDFDEVMALPEGVRDDLRRTLRLLAQIDAAPSVDAGCRAVGESRRGFTAASLRRKFYAYKAAGGDWRALVDRARCGDSGAARSFSDELAIHFQALAGQNARDKGAAAWRALLAQLQRGDALPGEGTWRDVWRKENPGVPAPDRCPYTLKDPPRGWGYRNLMRHRPRKAERIAQQQGRSALQLGNGHLLDVRRDTSRLEPLELIALDDVRFDFHVYDPDSGQICELWGVVAMDVATRCVLRYGLRPRLEREDGTREGILRRDVQTLLASIFLRHGFRRAGTTVLAENASAAITAGFKRHLEEVSGGAIQARATGLIRGNVFQDGWAVKAGGNPKAKAWIESAFNLMHNEAAQGLAARGYIGADYSLRPDDHTAKARWARELARQGMLLPPDLRREINLPFASLEESRREIDEVFTRMNARQIHQIEGFEKVLEWRWKGAPGAPWRDWLSMAGVPEAARGDIETRERTEMPLERWQRLYSLVEGRGGYLSLPDSAAPLLLMEHRVAKVAQNGAECSLRAGGKEMAFMLPDGCRPAAGDELLGYLPTMGGEDPEFVFLTDGAGRWLGQAERSRRVAVGDREAMARRIAQKQAHLTEILDAVRDRCGDARQMQRLDELDCALRAFSPLAGAAALPDRPAQISLADGGERVAAADASAGARALADPQKELRRAKTRGARRQAAAAGAAATESINPWE